MAIDTRDKRSSAIYTTIPNRAQYPNPDGVFNQADRQHIALVYRGIAAASPSGTTVVLLDHAMQRRVYSLVWGRVN